jgi:hypothetical protein
VYSRCPHTLLYLLIRKENYTLKQGIFQPQQMTKEILYSLQLFHPCTKRQSTSHKSYLIKNYNYTCFTFHSYVKIQFFCTQTNNMSKYSNTKQRYVRIQQHRATGRQNTATQSNMSKYSNTKQQYVRIQQHRATTC